MTNDWMTCPIDTSDMDLAGEKLKENWDRLHSGNLEPWPENETIQNAWRCYHLGDFAQAVNIGLELGGEGIVPAAFAGTIYAHYVEQDEDKKIEIFKQVMEWCEKAEEGGLSTANLHYIHAVAMGRYSQFISMIEALAQGFGGRIKEQAEKCLELNSKHAEGHATLAGWNAEISDQAGAMMAKMLYGATRESAVEHYATAIELAPHSPIPYIEHAAGIETMFGDSKKDEIIARLEEAVTRETVDAMQTLDQLKAKEHLAALKG